MSMNHDCCHPTHELIVSLSLTVSDERARWPSGLERWPALATGRCGTGSNPTADNFASELWRFRLPCFASVFRRRH